MKKYLLLLLTIFALNSCEQDNTIIEAAADKKVPKVEVCHYNAITDTWETKSINESALKAHLKHGDFAGSCDRTYVPDDAFEVNLIELGYDDVLDDYILTSNIESITDLSLLTCFSDYPGWDGADLFMYNVIGIEDFTALTNLTFASCDFPGTRLTNLDLSNNLALESLIMQFSSAEELNELNLSNNIALTNLFITYGYSLTNLDLSNNTALTNLTLETTAFSSLDLSNNIALTNLDLSYNSYLDNLNLKSGNNNLLTTFRARNLFNLNCIQVDDVVWSNTNWVDIDSWTSFSEDCSSSSSLAKASPYKNKKDVIKRITEFLNSSESESLSNKQIQRFENRIEELQTQIK